MTARYTSSEMRQRAVLLARGTRQALAGADIDPRIDRRLDRIDQAAQERHTRESAAALRLVDQAEAEVAAAKALERAAPRTDKAAARQARRQAEDALKRATRAARKYS